MKLGLLPGVDEVMVPITTNVRVVLDSDRFKFSTGGAIVEVVVGVMTSYNSETRYAHMKVPGRPDLQDVPVNPIDLIRVEK